MNAWTPTCRILALKEKHLFLRKPDNIYRVHSLWDCRTRKSQVTWSPRRTKCQVKPRTQMCGWKSGLGSGSSIPTTPAETTCNRWTAKPSKFSSVQSFSRVWLCDPRDCSIGEGNGNHSSVLAWRNPGTGEPGGLPSVGSHRVGHDWSDLAAAADSTMPGFPSQAKPFPNSVMGKPMRSSTIFNKLFPPQRIWWQNLEPFLGY